MKNLLINLQVFDDVYPTICFFKDQGGGINVSFYDKLIIMKRDINSLIKLYHHKSIYIPFKAYLNNSAYKGITYIRLTDIK